MVITRRARSTKAGVRTPATRSVKVSPVTYPSTLNEGRGSNPGDTGDDGDIGHDLRCRSTKAGVRTPATRGRHDQPTTCANAQRRPGFEPRRHGRGVTSPPSAPSSAQRRPGFEPRRHLNWALAGSRCRPRSTKAGVRTPATPLGGFLSGKNLILRSTKAGVRTPATRVGAADMREGKSALNEGRGSNPGDTRNIQPDWQLDAGAQRRPGFEPRRHIIEHKTGRGGKRCAQRRPGFEPRRHAALPRIHRSKLDGAGSRAAGEFGGRAGVHQAAARAERSEQPSLSAARGR